MAAPESWRSLMFVPAHVSRFIDAAPRAKADAYVLDLEDSVPDAQKPAARENLRTAAAKLAESGADVLVRINAAHDLAREDIKAAAASSVRAIVAPKIGARDQLEGLDTVMSALEGAAGLLAGRVGVIAQIEDVHALAALDEICRAPRLIGLSLGSEDFSHSAGMRPTLQTLYHPNQQIVFACRRHGLAPYGFPASIADYSDLDALRRAADLAADMGFGGAFCIHPRQVAVLNAAFAPTAPEFEEARRIVRAFHQAKRDGRGAVQLDGKMIDPPVVARAQALMLRGAVHLHGLNLDEVDLDRLCWIDADDLQKPPPKS
ncbi:MAG: CoA ester lyase [Hyphomonadaceae bacterium]